MQGRKCLNAVKCVNTAARQMSPFFHVQRVRSNQAATLLTSPMLQCVAITPFPLLISGSATFPSKRLSPQPRRRPTGARRSARRAKDSASFEAVSRPCIRAASKNPPTYVLSILQPQGFALGFWGMLKMYVEGFWNGGMGFGWVQALPTPNSGHTANQSHD